MSGKLSRVTKSFLAEIEARDSGLYLANERGQIYSAQTDKWLCLTRKPGGYLKFNAYLLSGIYTLHVHRFVWIYLRGNIPPGLWVNHINFNRVDNRISNLNLLTHQQNVRHSSEAGRFKDNGRHAIGEGNGRSKLNSRDAKAIRKALSVGVPAVQLAREYGVGYTAIYDIKTGKSWRHLWAD